MRAAIEEVTRKVREGATIHLSLEQTGLFPPMLVHLIASGEATGRLEEMLERSAVSQERDLKAALDAMVSLLGPVVILVMGLLVMFIMGAILMPIMKMNQLYQ
jgi:general secretion pathway protein F